MSMLVIAAQDIEAGEEVALSPDGLLWEKSGRCCPKGSMIVGTASARIREGIRVLVANGEAAEDDS